MNRIAFITSISIVALLFRTQNSSAQGTTFTYQGRLTQSAAPANNLYEMQFTLFDTLTNGNQIGVPVSLGPVPVTNGLFTVLLDFGAAPFTGNPRWLEITLNLFGSDMVPTTLSPRQPITPTPYAIHAANAAGLMNFGAEPLDIKVNGQRVLRLEANPGTAPNVIGGASVNGVAPSVLGATIGGGGNSSPGFEATNRIEANFGTISGGAAHMIQGRSQNSTISGGWQNTIYADAGWSTIGGGESNTIEPNARYSTISGGGLNKAGGFASSIGGGSLNTVQTNADHASIGGGLRNLIAANAMQSTIAGGNMNDIGMNSSNSVIGGGNDNHIANDSEYATIPGGAGNVAASRAFAAGTGAKANHSGAFVWGDSTLADVISTNANSVTMRAGGGYRLFSNGGLNAGVFLAAGGGSWTAISDRNAKENFEPVNGRAVLEKVAALPLATWNYKSQDSSIRHLGPTAQDFKAAFAVGETDTGITSVDADGVAFAAIQGLNQKLDQQMKANDRQIELLQKRNKSLEERVERLEQILRTLSGQTVRHSPNGNDEGFH